MNNFEEILTKKGFIKVECFGGTFNYILKEGKFNLSVNSALPWLYKMYSINPDDGWFDSNYNIPRKILTEDDLDELIKIFNFLHN